jgi:hypothetical protein
MRGKTLSLSACYVAAKDTFTAHGETGKDAVRDVLYKEYVEKLQHEPLKPTQVIDIPLYRALTGACQAGVERWMEQNGVKKKKMRVCDLLPLLAKTNAYGYERLKDLVEASV